MEEIAEIFNKVVQFEREQEELKNELEAIFLCKLWKQDTGNFDVDKQPSIELNVTPKQSKKRPKRLTAVEENDEKSTPKPTPRANNSRLLESEENVKDFVISVVEGAEAGTSKSQGDLRENSSLVSSKSAVELMPPPPAPTIISASSSDLPGSARPQRAAKINCEKNLKEPSLNKKLRRPSGSDQSVKVKLEHEQRISQMHEATPSTMIKTVENNASTSSDSSLDSVVMVADKAPSIVTVASDLENDTEKSANTESRQRDSGVRPLCIRIKREKLSTSMKSKSQEFNELEKQTAVQNETQANVIESSMAATILSTTTTNSSTVNTTQPKKERKKKTVPKPIKVERLSEELTEPIASRTRGNSFGNKKVSNQHPENATRPEGDRSIYEEALDNLPVAAVPIKNFAAAVNETVTISHNKNNTSGPAPADATVIIETAPCDATYCTANAGTFVIDQQIGSSAAADLTFDVNNEKTTNSQRSSKQSMETARETLQPRGDSLITEDESYECIETAVAKSALPPQQAPQLPAKTNLPTLYSSKTLPMPPKISKMPTRTIEIFNPLVQSPIKKKIQAYEDVAAQSTSNGKRTRSKLAKENSAPLQQSSAITPLIGKLNGPALGRFLTPSQFSNTVTPNSIAQNKKMPASASKALTLPKTNSAGNLRSGATSSAKGLSRENSTEEFRKGLHQMAEERRKQREQKHLLAAQQREAKERERAERLAKVAKEREEKRLKKQQEAEQRKRELEDIQKVLRAQEEAAATDHAKQKAKAVMEQEKAMLQQIKQQPQNGSSKATRMLPPKPKCQTKYTFEMLHEDDSTDDESKVSYKRPPPPTWSRSHVRTSAILLQQHMPTDIIDSFFSVQPMTPDLKDIFPAIDKRYLKRNSSVIWSTPPRYSELPEY